MRRAERIVDVEIRQTCQLLRELLVVRFFLRMKAEVLQKQRLAFFQLRGHFFRLGSDAVWAEPHVFAARQFLVEHHAQPLGHRLQAHLQIGLALGPSQMRGQNQPRPVPQGVFDGGQSFADARVVHDASVFQRNVEVDAHEDAVAVEREITDGKLGHWLVVLIRWQLFKVAPPSRRLSCGRLARTSRQPARCRRYRTYKPLLAI
jgi:hypothetical protein